MLSKGYHVWLFILPLQRGTEDKSGCFSHPYSVHSPIFLFNGKINFSAPLGNRDGAA